MTDEQLDRQIEGAYAHVEMSAEAEDRILANLLAAERDMGAERDKGTGSLSRPAPEQGKTSALPSRPISLSRRRWRWIAPTSIAAVLLVGVIVGAGIVPHYAPDGAAGEKTAGIQSVATEESALDGGADGYDSANMDVGATGAEDETYSSDADGGRLYAVEGAEIVLLSDGSRFVIEDVYEASEDFDSDAFDWQQAAIQTTGDAVDAALLDDGTCLVRFEGEDTLYLAVAL